jgi:hypothetical protein
MHYVHGLEILLLSSQEKPEALQASDSFEEYCWFDKVFPDDEK